MTYEKVRAGHYRSINGNVVIKHVRYPYNSVLRWEISVNGKVKPVLFPTFKRAQEAASNFLIKEGHGV